MQWLYAISFTESSFNPKSKNKNANGSRDYGLMQINSIWKKEAKRMGYSWHKIKTNPCTNVMFGGHITAKAKRLRNKYYHKVRKNRSLAKRYIKRLRKKVKPV